MVYELACCYDGDTFSIIAESGTDSQLRKVYKRPKRSEPFPPEVKERVARLTDWHQRHREPLPQLFNVTLP